MLARSPELGTAADLVSPFAEMLSTLSGTDLPAWINQAAAANLPASIASPPV
ncbi:hypothetical protein ACIBRY_29715 [Streptomyces anulatus]